MHFDCEFYIHIRLFDRLVFQFFLKSGQTLDRELSVAFVAAPLVADFADVRARIFSFHFTNKKGENVSFDVCLEVLAVYFNFLTIEFPLIK